MHDNWIIDAGTKVLPKRFTPCAPGMSCHRRRICKVARSPARPANGLRRSELVDTTYACLA